MLMAVLLLSLLFIVSFIYFFSYVPAKKFTAWIKQLFVKRTSPFVPKEPIATESHQNRVTRNKAELENVFSTFDKNKDGYITKQELKESLKNIGILVGDEDVVHMVQKVDSDRDGMIDLDEFCKLLDLMMSREGTSTGEEGSEKVDREAELKEAFDIFDGDKNGLITVKELSSVLLSLGFMEGEKLEVCKEMIRKADVDGDGMVNFDEFKKMMKTGGRL